MASLVLFGSTSGSVTVQANAVANSNTLTLPDSTGTVICTGSSNVVTPTLLTQPLTLGTSQASTSGTSIDFTSIPSWVKRITVMWNGVSTNGSSNYLLQIGSGSYTTSGYSSVGCYGGPSMGGSVFTQGFGIPAAGGGNMCYGHFILTAQGSNAWVCSHSMGVNVAGTAYFFIGGGSVTLSGTLDRIRNTTANGTDAFDAGSINVLYE